MPKEIVTVKQTIERLVGIISDIMADSVMGDPAQYKTTLSAKLTNDPAQGWINERAYRAQAQGPMSSRGP